MPKEEIKGTVAAAKYLGCCRHILARNIKLNRVPRPIRMEGKASVWTREQLDKVQLLKFRNPKK